MNMLSRETVGNSRVTPSQPSPIVYARTHCHIVHEVVVLSVQTLYGT